MGINQWLGSWGEWAVANNLHASGELLDSLADSQDWQVRLLVAKNPNIPKKSRLRRENDAIVDIVDVAQARTKM